MRSIRTVAASSAAVGFLAGALVVGVAGTLWERRHPAVPPGSAPVPPVVEGAPMMVITPAEPMTPAAVLPPPEPDADALPVLGADPSLGLRERHLEMPVLGARRDALRETFGDPRSGARTHEAIDILAPRNTPVVAVEDGTIARLFRSDAGGITVYLFDPAARYVYYYAHLERYADRLVEGAPITRGQILGYVGTSGNAPADTPHLHFAIFKLSEKQQWWQGTPIDPYHVLK